MRIRHHKTSVSTLALAAAVVVSCGFRFEVASAFVPILRPFLPNSHRSHTTALLSTTESDARSRASSSDENGNDGNGDEDLQKDILSGLDKFATSELADAQKVGEINRSMKELEVDLIDEDFVLVGGRAAIEGDDALTMVSSELSIWTNLRIGGSRNCLAEILPGCKENLFVAARESFYL